jgi:hypothetical protein
MEKQTGWKPVPLSLKTLSVVFILWIIGSILNSPNVYKNGIPLFGVMTTGIIPLIFVLFLDVVGPIIFLYALWNRKSWAMVWALSYISIFILNSIVALFTVREQLGLIPILVPTIASTIFFITIYLSKSYFITGGEKL